MAIRTVIIFLIKLYQKVLSPDHSWLRLRFPGGVCRYTPTCSNYMIDAINHYGAIKGVIVGIKRVLRCHPFVKGGYDPVKRVG